MINHVRMTRMDEQAWGHILAPVDMDDFKLSADLIELRQKRSDVLGLRAGEPDEDV